MSKSAFTLIEVVMAVLILGILGAVAVPKIIANDNFKANEAITALDALQRS